MRLSLALCAILWACGGTPTPLAAGGGEPRDDINLAPKGHGLGDGSLPTAYRLHMRIDPESGAFRGVIDIDIEVTRALHTFWLHQRDLVIESASFQRGGRTQALIPQMPESGEHDFLGLAAGAEIRPGPGRLHIEFKAHFGNVSGLFRQLEEGRWYAYSDFEATDARAAFPCYDEPRFKVPWDITIDVPAGSLAVANTGEVARHALPGGEQRFVFATSRPLPTYLVAMAAGPFDVIEGMASRTPLRIIAPHGQAEGGRFVLETTDTWLRFFESYLGMRLPYDKLDFIAVPHFGGAMENPGLVTFSSSILLTGRAATDDALRLAAGVTAHELAHMWFGDLITPRDWNDLWLNEGFATWLSDKAVAAYQPHRAREILDIADKSLAYASDHSLHGRRVREPIDSAADVREAFDAITYRKGGALLTMLEGWIGEERMQAAVRRYARSFIDGNVRTEDLFSELLAATGDRQIVRFLHSYLSQTGIPQIAFELDCSGAPRLAIEQRRYLPLSVRASAAKSDLDRQWRLPVCFRYGAGTESHRQCSFLEEARRHIDLEGTCPTWVQPNDEDTGYYHSLLSAQGFAALAERPLDPRETQGLVHNLVFALESGDLPLADALPILARFAPAGPAELQAILVPFLYRLSFAVIGDEERDAFAAMIRRWYGPRVRALGLQAVPAESTQDAELRPVLLQLVADLGQDHALRRMAREQAAELLSRRATVDLELLGSVLEVAAIDGDRALMQRYLDAMGRSSDPPRRARLLGALHAFGDPELFAEALQRSLGTAKRHAYLWPILVRAAADPARRAALWRAFDEHRGALLRDEQRDDTFELLAQLSSALCTETALEGLEELAADDFDLRPLDAEIRGCMAFANQQRPSAAAFFAPADASAAP